MVQQKRWGKKFEDKRDWKVYHEELIIRGEFFFDFIRIKILLGSGFDTCLLRVSSDSTTQGAHATFALKQEFDLEKIKRGYELIV